MKFPASTTLLFLLVIGFSGGASGQDFEETKRLAEQGEANAQYNLGSMYRTGDGVPENVAEALKFYRLSAEQGYASAHTAIMTFGWIPYPCEKATDFWEPMFPSIKGKQKS